MVLSLFMFSIEYNRMTKKDPKTKNAFVLIHFGSNPKYLELEIYFCIMLKKYTKTNIVYMYSVLDTPASFAREISPYVYKTIGFNDSGITYNVNFTSNYSSFNTLRTCDFIFAYTLTEYEKICIVESDLVIMSEEINDVFNQKMPAMVCYRCGNDSEWNRNLLYASNKKEVLRDCTEKSGMNGGVIVFEPSETKFQEYLQAVPIIASTGCKYPNEALFEYVNERFYNLPVRFNISHYHTLRLKKYEMNPNGKDVVVFHFNETAHKHLDVLKDNWLEENRNNPKYKIKLLPIMHFKNTIYDHYHSEVEAILSRVEGNKQIDDDWIEVYTNTYDTNYWYNRVTGESVWTKPMNGGGSRKSRRLKPYKNRRTAKIHNS